jgi:hypothetical protein
VAAVAQKLDRIVGLEQGVATALAGDHIARAPTGCGVETPVVLDHRTPIGWGPERLVVAGAVLQLQPVGGIEEFSRHSGQAGTAVTLAGVKDRAAGFLVEIDLEGLADFEHTAARNGQHLLRARVNPD